MLFHLPFSNVRYDHYLLCRFKNHLIVSIISQQLNK